MCGLQVQAAPGPTGESTGLKTRHYKGDSKRCRPKGRRYIETFEAIGVRERAMKKRARRYLYVRAASTARTRPYGRTHGSEDPPLQKAVQKDTALKGGAT